MPANKFWNTSAPAMPTSDVKLLLESLKAKKVTHVTPTTILHRTRCEFDSSPAAARRARARSVTTEGQDAELPAPQPRHGGGIRSSCRSIHFTTATAAYCGYVRGGTEMGGARLKAIANSTGFLRRVNLDETSLPPLSKEQRSTRPTTGATTTLCWR
ncbi:hypothetical protein JG687_00016453 [Phytophthora cactorum]|uniref:Uncharacterized protein n=1 Tax=Phytophthora cactorum TaxID=29920 RepID=A0A8T1TS45_9STRA|nr:hypothetical protein PC120_g21146 [Phytophthora cactorum]KAG4042907.1 hypothetical protein PC123_g21618 [Phytophthora cactorum]KAG6946909.1 hypothetical protein JG687_00016453 [Phytophthora cactorum]